MSVSASVTYVYAQKKRSKPQETHKAIALTWVQKLQAHMNVATVDFRASLASASASDETAAFRVLLPHNCELLARLECSQSTDRRPLILQIEAFQNIALPIYAMEDDDTAPAHRSPAQRRLCGDRKLQTLDDDDDSNGTSREREEQTSNTAGPIAKTRKRLLKLVLTDGRQLVSAIELEPILVLPDEPAVGMKVILSGQLEIARGLLLLRANNVSLYR